MNKLIIALFVVLALGTCALAEGDLGGVADASIMTDVVDVVEEGMVPVTAESLNDGVYGDIAVDSSSSMFKIVGCELTVADGALTAKLTMKSDAYLYLYPGTAEDAAAAAEEDVIALEQEGDEYFFTFPVTALDAGVDCAAYSARKQVWYPRTLVFRADSLPLEAWGADSLVTAGSLGLADGEYTVEASLEGGKTTVESPATLKVSGGECLADIVFSTKKIDYVLVDGEKVLPTNDEGNAAFTIPVSAFDIKLGITLDSTAILPATEVPYTIRFDSATIAEK